MTKSFEVLMRNTGSGVAPVHIDEEQRRVIIDGAISATPNAPRHPRRIRLVAVAAAVTLAVGGFAYQGLGAQADRAAAREVLSQAAIHAQDAPVSPGQYWEITMNSTTLNGVDDALYLVSVQDFDYVDVLGSRPDWYVRGERQLLRQVSGPSQQPVFEGVRDVWTTNIPANEMPGSWQMPSSSWLAELPRDPIALRERLDVDVVGHGSDPIDAVFVYVVDVLRSGRVPAELRAALFEVLKELPGTRVTDREATIDGRTGVAIGRPDIFGSHTELIIDPDGGQVLGERTDHQLGRVPFIGEAVTLETSYARTLVDEIPANIRTEAHHQVCTVLPDGAMECD